MLVANKFIENTLN